MLIRSFATRCRPRARLATHSSTFRLTPQGAPRHIRSYASPSSPPAAAPGPATSTAGILAPFTSELDKIAPRFDIDGSQITVLRTPTEFYDTLKSKIAGAERRIFLSTLYIGKTETELVRIHCVEESQLQFGGFSHGR
jgi:CDP-diacylglycerol---glycerol-3-phosphate 3-phosphatidyltransferase